jgi:hypothetical protein
MELLSGSKKKAVMMDHQGQLRTNSVVAHSADIGDYDRNLHHVVKVAEAGIGPSHIDECAALAAPLFLINSASSHLLMRFSDRRRMGAHCERH